jgi:hypothetical protein
MKKFFIYQKDNDYICQKDGFSLMACILNIFWFLYLRNWHFAAAYFLFNLLTTSLEQKFPFIIYSQLFMMIATGIAAPIFIHNKMLKDGYKPISIIYAKNEDKALLKYLRKI